MHYIHTYIHTYIHFLFFFAIPAPRRKSTHGVASQTQWVPEPQCRRTLVPQLAQRGPATRPTHSRRHALQVEPRGTAAKTSPPFPRETRHGVGRPTPTLAAGHTSCLMWTLKNSKLPPCTGAPEQVSPAGQPTRATYVAVAELPSRDLPGVIRGARIKGSRAASTNDRNLTGK